MQPHILIERLASYFDLPDQLLMLILNFLIERLQQVFVNEQMSKLSVSDTGSSQGCVLSPILFKMHTDSCRSSLENRFLVKISDDTVLYLYFKAQSLITVLHCLSWFNGATIINLT